MALDRRTLMALTIAGIATPTTLGGGTADIGRRWGPTPR